MSGGINDGQWNVAISKTVQFNASLEYAQRRRGPFYHDPNTGTTQCIGTRVLPHVVIDTNDSMGYFEVWEKRRRKKNTHTTHTHTLTFTQTEALRFTMDSSRAVAEANKVKTLEAGRPPKLLQIPVNPICPGCKRSSDAGPRVVTCMLCLNSYHGACVDLNEQQTQAAIASHVWQCNWCKVCTKCTLGNDEELFVLCDNCDSGYHVYCLTPKLSSVPAGTWRCDRCVVCKSCGSRKSTRWWDEYSLCNDCHTAIRRGEVCPVCKLPHAAGASAVLCEGCNKWVHVNGQCEGPTMTTDLWNQLSSGAIWFQCSACEQRVVAPQSARKAASSVPPRDEQDEEEDEEKNVQLNDVDVDAELEEQQKKSGRRVYFEPVAVVTPTFTNVEGGFSCMQCGKVFPVLANLKRHMVGAHRSRAGGKRRRHYGSDDEDEEDVLVEPDEDMADSGEAEPPVTVAKKAAPAKNDGDTSSYPCEECDRTFPNAQARSTHLTLSHGRTRSSGKKKKEREAWE